MKTTAYSVENSPKTNEKNLKKKQISEETFINQKVRRIVAKIIESKDPRVGLGFEDLEGDLFWKVLRSFQGECDKTGILTVKDASEEDRMIYFARTDLES